MLYMMSLDMLLLFIVKVNSVEHHSNGVKFLTSDMIMA